MECVYIGYKIGLSDDDWLYTTSLVTGDMEERYKVCDLKPHEQVHKKKFKETTLQEPQYCSMNMATLNTHQDNIYSTAGNSGNDTMAIVHKVNGNGDTDKKHRNCKCQYLLALFAGVVVLGLAGCVAFLFHETIELKSQTASFQQLLSSQQEGQLSFSLASSCAALPPSSPSDYYWVRASDGSAVSVYCDMTLSCGGVTGGWMRVAELDMTNSSHQCPSGLRQRTDSGKRSCGIINSNSGTCSSVTFPIKSLGYSKVCGKIIAYQVGSTDGFAAFGNRNPGINGNYVDGVSLTYGNPRNHIWTFAAALHEFSSHHVSSCPCTVGTNANFATHPPAFVGNDYFCDTGSAGQFEDGKFYSDDPLWDGAGCESQNTCCSFNNPPWFYKQLSQPTTDDIEMRLCRDESLTNEDIPVEMIDIYVQ